MINKLPVLRKIPSQALLPKITSKYEDNIGETSIINRSNIKFHSTLGNPLPIENKFKTLSRTQAVEGIKTLSLLGKQHDLAGQTIEASHRASQTQLKPLENSVAKLEDQRKLKPIVFNQEAGGSLDTKEIEKMEDKDYLTPLDFIACWDRDPEFVNRFCYWYRWGDFYDFRIVPFEKLKLGKDKSQREEYMTVSASGIVHFNVNNEATFLTIPEWEREKILYTKLKGIRFFRQYFIWKSFSAWKTLMRNNQISHTSETLSRELFILDKELSQPLLNIRTSTLMIAEMDIVKMTSDFPRSLEQFISEQREHRRILK